MRKRISVVIPTFRRNDLLERCLSALVSQDINPEDYEILVVDNAGDQSTSQLVESWYERWDGYELLPQETTGGVMEQAQEDLQNEDNARKLWYQSPSGPVLRYLCSAGPCGPAAARNLGWKEAEGEIIAFTHDDTIPWPNWLRTGLEYMQGDVAGVSGQVLVPIPVLPTDYELRTTRLEESEFVTANCFYRRDVLEQIGGFDERFKTAWCEDSDLYFSLLKRGYNLSHAPTAIVVHPVRPGKWGVSINQQIKSQYNALLFKKHPTLYRTYIQKRPPLHYYAILGTLVVIIFSILTSRQAVAVIAFSLWAFQVAAFAVNRLRHTSRKPSHIAEMVITSMLIPILAIFWRLWGAVRFRVPFV